MKVAILESIVMPAGHEVEFDRILVDELKNQGHEPVFFVPDKFPFKFDYKAGVEYLCGGEAISYAGIGRIKKLYLSLQRAARRKKWFDSAYEKACSGLCEAIIIPTASYRFISSVKNSKLKNSPVPVLLILHGIMPRDRDIFIKQVLSCNQYSNIHIAVLGLQQDFSELKDCKNFHTILPPVYKPMDLSINPDFNFHNPLRLGFFGQYRREKNVEFFLQAFVEANFNIPVELLIQGATVNDDDAKDFQRLQEKYSYVKNIKFLHKSLIGIDWQKAIMDIDVMLIPYGAQRYRYQPSAMLFTAMGYFKPVLQSPEMSPEVLEEFSVGEIVNLTSVEDFKCQLEQFVNNFNQKTQIYKKALLLANEKYGHVNLIKNIIAIFKL